MMKKIYFALLAAVVSLVLASCQQAIVEDSSDTSTDAKVTLNLSVAQFEQVPFSQAKARRGTRATKIDSVCTKLCFAIYKSAGDAHPTTVLQTVGEKDFGSVRLALDKGTYYLVVLAHSSSINPDMSNIQSIDFSKYVTDTFYACDTLTIDHSLDKDIRLRRAVARLELTTTDNLPDTCTSLKLTLGNVCTAFNPVTGHGATPGDKTYTATFDQHGKGKPFSFGRNFFPAAEDSKTSLSVTLYTGDKPTFTRRLTDIPVSRNTVTRYTGRLFSNLSFALSMQSDDEWGVNTVTF